MRTGGWDEGRGEGERGVGGCEGGIDRIQKYYGIET